MNLNVQPLKALCDEEVKIYISGLPPYEKVKITASMHLPWAEDVKFESQADFKANSKGDLDLSKVKPESGDYNFINSMGLIVSMHTKNKKAINKITKNISIDKNLFIDIKAECKQNEAIVKLERIFKINEVKKLQFSNPFVGELYYSENTDNKILILLGGSGSELSINSPIAGVLASHGLDILSLSYFRDKGLPEQLSEIPLEYFENLFNWLSNNPLTKDKEINLFGISKGGELALLLASRYNHFAKIAAISPHAYCFQGIAFKNVSSWTYKGKSIPFIRLKNIWLLTNMINCIIKNKTFGFTHTYKMGIEKANNRNEARIKVENSKAKILLVTTKQNNIWNSYDGCMEIMETLRKNDYKYGYDLVVYENAGEPFYVPFVIPLCETTTVKFAPRLRFSTGGTLDGNLLAQSDSWKKVIEFFKR